MHQKLADIAATQATLGHKWLKPSVRFSRTTHTTSSMPATPSHSQGALATPPYLVRRAPQAALRPSSPCATSVSAICTAFSAAPLRRLSDTHQNASPFSTVGSRRRRLI